MTRASASTAAPATFARHGLSSFRVRCDRHTRTRRPRSRNGLRASSTSSISALAVGMFEPLTRSIITVMFFMSLVPVVSVTGHLNRGFDGIFEIVRVVSRRFVSIAEVHSIRARAHLAQSEPEMAGDRFSFLERHGFLNRHWEAAALEPPAKHRTLKQLASSWLLTFGNGITLASPQGSR